MGRLYMPHGSDEWYMGRIGKITSTRMQIVAHGTAHAQTKLLDHMQWEIENPEEAIEQDRERFREFTPSSIALGREREEWAIARYEILRQQQIGRRIKLDRPGLVQHDGVDYLASSPDFINVTEQGVPGEVKVRVDARNRCVPTLAEKHNYLIKRGLPPEDKGQCYTHMMCEGVSSCHYVSFCPEWDDETTRCVWYEVIADQEYIDFLYAECRRFMNHLKAGTRPGLADSDDLVDLPDFE